MKPWTIFLYGAIAGLGLGAIVANIFLVRNWQGVSSGVLVAIVGFGLMLRRDRP